VSPSAPLHPFHPLDLAKSWRARSPSLYSDSEKDDPIHSRLSGSSIRRGLRSVEQGAQEVQLVASKVETTARFAEQAERNYEQQGFFQPDGAAGRRPRSASRGRLAEGTRHGLAVRGGDGGDVSAV